MASHAHTTSPLLRSTAGAPLPLLPLGAKRSAVGHGESPGPVTLALRAVREAVEAPRRTGPVTDAIRTMRAAPLDERGLA